jgi:hypothetical protein
MCKSHIWKGTNFETIKKCWQECRVWNTVLHWEDCKLVQLCGKQFGTIFNKSKWSYHMIQNLYFWVYTPKNWKLGHKQICVQLSKEGNSDTYNMNETWRHASWNYPVTKGQILHYSTHMRYMEYSNSYGQKVECWLAGNGGKRESREENKELLFNVYYVSVFSRWKKFCRCMVVMVAQQCEWTWCY